MIPTSRGSAFGRGRLVSSRRDDRAGLTLLELMLGIALTAVVGIKAYGAMRSMTRATRTTTEEVVMDDQARQVMQQIAFAIMGANRETLVPDTGAPISMQDMRFQVNLGVQDGEVVWSPPEQIALDELENAVYWSDAPGVPEQRRIVWSRIVAPFLEGELPNGMDDNGNGLIDERGLSFVVDRDAITVRLTLSAVQSDGSIRNHTVNTTVTCRNTGALSP